MKKLVTFSLMLGLVLSANFAYAQPANDDCANAISLTIAADEASCAAVTGNTTGGTPSAAGYVCSGSWFGDDIWFSFTTGMMVPADGYTIKLTPGTTTTFGMALYTGCGTSEMPFHCFSNGDGTITEATAKGMTPNTTYYVRVWSGGSPTANSGTFDICVFNSPADPATVIWEEDFANGISNWTVVSTPTGADWEWMPIATAGRGTFADSSLVSNSVSSINGAVIFDSDYYDNSGIAAAPQAGELISPMIDCSNAPAVGLEFSQRFRQFQSTTTVSYSTDGGSTYTDIVINGATAVNNSITRAEERQALFLNTAGGQDSVVIKFRFDADYYYWILDDIRLVSLPAVSDLAVSDYIYPADVYGTPTTQASVSDLEFSLLASNLGSTDITGVMAYATVSDGTNTLFADSVSMGTINSGVDSVAVFPNAYDIENLAVGTYTIEYSLGSDSTDFNPADNSETRQFAITDSTFRNDAGATGASRPGGGGDYLLGNLYEMAPNTAGDVWQVTTAYFTAAKNAADGPLDGSQVSVYLVELSDTLADDLANLDVATPLFQNTGLSVVGLGTYTFATGTSNYDDFFVPMADFTTGAIGVDLKPATRYFLMVEYAGGSNVIFGGLQSVDGGPSGILYSTQWFTGGFADAAPVARMDISLKDTNASSTTQELTNASLSVFPNPASDYINLDIEFAEATDATVFITDVSGRLVKTQVLGTITQERATIDVSDLAAGTYMVRLSTNEGFKVQRVVITK